LLCQPGLAAASNMTGSCTHEKTRQPARTREKHPAIRHEEEGMVEQLHKSV